MSVKVSDIEEALELAASAQQQLERVIAQVTEEQNQVTERCNDIETTQMEIVCALAGESSPGMTLLHKFCQTATALEAGMNDTRALVNNTRQLAEVVNEMFVTLEGACSNAFENKADRFREMESARVFSDYSAATVSAATVTAKASKDPNASTGEREDKAKLRNCLRRTKDQAHCVAAKITMLLAAGKGAGGKDEDDGIPPARPKRGNSLTGFERSSLTSKSARPPTEGFDNGDEDEDDSSQLAPPPVPTRGASFDSKPAPPLPGSAGNFDTTKQIRSIAEESSTSADADVDAAAVSPTSESQPERGPLRLYLFDNGNEQEFKSLFMTTDSTVTDVLRMGVKKFRLDCDPDHCDLLSVETLPTGVTERKMMLTERPYRTIVNRRKLDQPSDTLRFYLRSPAASDVLGSAAPQAACHLRLYYVSDEATRTATVMVDMNDNTFNVIEKALPLFDLHDEHVTSFSLAQVLLQHPIDERPLGDREIPLRALRERSEELRGETSSDDFVRFYLRRERSSMELASQTLRKGTLTVHAGPGIPVACGDDADLCVDAVTFHISNFTDAQQVTKMAIERLGFEWVVGSFELLVVCPAGTGGAAASSFASDSSSSSAAVSPSLREQRVVMPNEHPLGLLERFIALNADANPPRFIVRCVTGEASVADTTAANIMLARVRQRRDNSFCVDCNASDPVFVSLNFGSLLCGVCARIHNRLSKPFWDACVSSTKPDNRFFSKVRAVHYVAWADSQPEHLLASGGNSLVNAVYERNCPSSKKPLPNASESAIQTHICRKYLDCVYIDPVHAPDIDLSRELFCAAADGDLFNTMRFLALGADLLRIYPRTTHPNMESDSSSALHAAAVGRNAAVCTLLCEFGLPPVTRDSRGRTALYWCARLKSAAAGSVVTAYQRAYSVVEDFSHDPARRKLVSLVDADFLELAADVHMETVTRAFGSASSSSDSQRQGGAIEGRRKLARLVQHQFATLASNLYVEMELRQRHMLRCLVERTPYARRTPSDPDHALDRLITWQQSEVTAGVRELEVDPMDRCSPHGDGTAGGGRGGVPLDIDDFDDDDDALSANVSNAGYRLSASDGGPVPPVPVDGRGEEVDEDEAHALRVEEARRAALSAMTEFSDIVQPKPLLTASPMMPIDSAADTPPPQPPRRQNSARRDNSMDMTGSQQQPLPSPPPPVPDRDVERPEVEEESLYAELSAPGGDDEDDEDLRAPAPVPKSASKPLSVIYNVPAPRPPVLSTGSLSELVGDPHMSQPENTIFEDGAPGFVVNSSANVFDSPRQSTTDDGGVAAPAPAALAPPPALPSKDHLHRDEEDMYMSPRDLVAQLDGSVPPETPPRRVIARPVEGGPPVPVPRKSDRDSSNSKMSLDERLESIKSRRKQERSVVGSGSSDAAIMRSARQRVEQSGSRVLESVTGLMSVVKARDRAQFVTSAVGIVHKGNELLENTESFSVLDQNDSRKSRVGIHQTNIRESLDKLMSATKVAAGEDGETQQLVFQAYEVMTLVKNLLLTVGKD